jgi:hypothetical protein
MNEKIERNEEKVAWQAPKLVSLDVSDTMSGPIRFAFEIFDQTCEPVGGPSSS